MAPIIRYVSSQLKFDMLIRAPAFARAGVELVDQLASCFVLHRAPSGATLYHAGDRPNGAFLLIEGTVDLFAPPRLNLSGPRSFEDTQPSLVMRRSQLSECAWVGEGTLIACGWPALHASAHHSAPCECVWVGEGTLMTTECHCLRPMTTDEL